MKILIKGINNKEQKVKYAYIKLEKKLHASHCKYTSHDEITEDRCDLQDC